MYPVPPLVSVHPGRGQVCRRGKGSSLLEESLQHQGRVGVELGGRSGLSSLVLSGTPSGPPPALSPSFHRLQWEGPLVSTELSPAWPRAICLWVVNPPRVSRKWTVAWNPH